MPDANTMTTYRMADGSEVYGEFSIVLDEEYFTEGDEKVEVVKEVWRCVERVWITYNESPEDDDD